MSHKPDDPEQRPITSKDERALRRYFEERERLRREIAAGPSLIIPNPSFRHKTPSILKTTRAHNTTNVNNTTSLVPSQDKIMQRIVRIIMTEAPTKINANITVQDGARARAMCSGSTTLAIPGHGNSTMLLEVQIINSTLGPSTETMVILENKTTAPQYHHHYYNHTQNVPHDTQDIPRRPRQSHIPASPSPAPPKESAWARLTTRLLNWALSLLQPLNNTVVSLITGLLNSLTRLINSFSLRNIIDLGNLLLQVTKLLLITLVGALVVFAATGMLLGLFEVGLAPAHKSLESCLASSVFGISQVCAVAQFMLPRPKLEELVDADMVPTAFDLHGPELNKLALVIHKTQRDTPGVIPELRYHASEHDFSAFQDVLRRDAQSIIHDRGNIRRLLRTLRVKDHDRFWFSWRSMESQVEGWSDSLRDLLSEARNRRIQAARDLDGASIKELGDMICSWHEDLIDAMNEKETSVKRAEKAMSNPSRWEFLWSFSSNYAEQQEMNEEDLSAVKRDLKRLQLMRSQNEFRCRSTTTSANKVSRLLDAMVREIRWLDLMIKQVHRVKARLRRDGDWRSAVRELVGIMEGYIAIVEDLYRFNVRS